MAEHKTPADSRNNLKKRIETSLNQYGRAKINGYSGSLEKTLLHYFTEEVSDAIDSLLGDPGQESERLGTVLKHLKPLLSCHVAEKGWKWLWTGATLCSM